MKQKIVYIGLDVDDTQYHGSALNKETGELLSFRCRPTLKGLLGHLAKIRKHFPKHTVQVAYEASYIGFTLQRDLLRSRQRLMHQRERVRRHLQGALRRNGLHYRAETGHKSHWTIQHYSWLRALDPGYRQFSLPLRRASVEL